MVSHVLISLKRLDERFGIHLKTQLRKPSSIYIPTPKSEYVSKKPSRKPSTVIIEEEPEVRVWIQKTVGSKLEPTKTGPQGDHF